MEKLDTTKISLLFNMGILSFQVNYFHNIIKYDLVRKSLLWDTVAYLLIAFYETKLGKPLLEE